MTKKNGFTTGLMVSAAFFAAGVLYTACEQPTDDETAKNGGGDNGATGIPKTVSDIVPTLDWIKANGKPGSSYTIIVTKDETIEPQMISTGIFSGFPKNVTITIKSASSTSIKRVQLSERGAMFYVLGSINLVLQDIILDGLSRQTIEGCISDELDNNSALVMIGSDSQFEMKTGSKITGNTNAADTLNYHGGGVYVDGGKKFTMSGGSISGNTASTFLHGGGGVYFDGDIFTMSGNAVISGNTANGGDGGGVYFDGDTFMMSGNAAISGNKAFKDSYYNNGRGGGIYFSGGIFTMSGNAVISGNTADNVGGGVYVSVAYSGGRTFSKTGGTIYGSDGGSMKNTAGTNGHAVYVKKPLNSLGAALAYVRNTTAGPDVNLSSTDLTTNWE